MRVSIGGERQRGLLRSWSRAILAAPCLAWCLLVPAPASADLSLVGGQSARTVELTEDVEGGVGSKAEKARSALPRGERGPFEIQGELSLDVRNTSPFPVQLRVLYSRQDDGNVQILPGESGALSIEWPAVSETALRETATRLSEDLGGIATGSRSRISRSGAAAADALAVQLSILPVRPTKPQLSALTRAIVSAVRSPGSVAPVDFERSLSRARCPLGPHCPAIPETSARALLESLEAPSGEAIGQRLIASMRAAIVSTEPRTYPSIPAHSVSTLRLRVRLSDVSSPESLSGAVELQAYTIGGARKAGEVAVPVTARVQALGDVRFDPTTVVIRLSKACAVFSCGTSSAAVQLYGAGVGRLIATTTASTRILGTLSHEDRSLSVALEGIKGDPNRVDAATARVTLVGHGVPRVGKYTGVLAISHLLADSPSVKVEVDSRVWELWAVLLVAGGVLLAGLVFQVLPLWRRRRSVRKAVSGRAEELHRTLGGLPEALRHSAVGIAVGRAAELHDDKTLPNYLRLSAEDPSSILTAARWARNQEEMAEVVKVAGEFVTISDLWAVALEQLEKLDAKLASLDSENPPGWSASPEAEEARKARDAALSGSPRDLLTTSLGRYLALVEAWELKRTLVDVLPASDAHLARDIDFSEQSRAPYIELDRSYQRVLDASLGNAIDRLEALRGKASDSAVLGRIDSVPEPLPATILEPAAESMVADPYLVVSMAAQQTAPSPTGDASAVGAGPAVPAASSLAEATRYGAAHAVKPSLGALLDVRVSSWLVTFGVVIVTSLAYTATIYNNTCGTFDDLVGALGAGFIGRVTLNWALLPIFDSVVLRVKDGSGQRS